MAAQEAPVTSNGPIAHHKDKVLTPEEKIALIKENLDEMIDPEIIEDVIIKQGRDLVLYWGTATTGRPHAAYFVPALKIAQFLRAGCKVKILLADIHGFLDNLKAPIELVMFRAEYYRFCITAILKAVGVQIDSLEFVLGSTYQKSEKYIMDLFKLSCMTSDHDAKRAGAEVVKQSESSPLSGLIYPLMQSLDEEHLGVDAQFGGVDQRKIFTLAKEILPKIGYRQRAHLLNPMVPGLQGGKMSASDPQSKIDLLDPPEVVKQKLRKAFAVPREVEGNGILAFTKFVLLPAGALKYGRAEFHVDRSRDGLEPLVYTDSASMEKDYANDVLTPQLLKAAVTTALLDLMKPIQDEYQSSKEWQDIALKAYPPVEEEGKKKKKGPKDKGSRYPGATKAAIHEGARREPGPTDAEKLNAEEAGKGLEKLEIES